MERTKDITAILFPESKIRNEEDLEGVKFGTEAINYFNHELRPEERKDWFMVFSETFFLKNRLTFAHRNAVHDRFLYDVCKGG